MSIHPHVTNTVMLEGVPAAAAAGTAREGSGDGWASPGESLQLCSRTKGLVPHGADPTRALWTLQPQTVFPEQSGSKR